jgi:hypothetical protein
MPGLVDRRLAWNRILLGSYAEVVPVTSTASDGPVILWYPSVPSGYQD